MLAVRFGALAVFASHSAVTSASDLPQTSHPTETLDPVFGEGIPNTRFVQQFQRQVVQQLNDLFGQERREQEARLQRFEERQDQKLTDELASLRRAVGEVHGTSSAQAAPKVNIRHPQEATTAETTLPAIEPLTSAPANLRKTHAAAQLSPQMQRAQTMATLSPHGFVEGVLLNGVVAAVGGPDRESVVALTGPYQAANGFSTNLDGCLALVQGRPELSAGRIDFKVSRLTCNFPDGASKTWDVSGWLVDTDGIRGLRAEIVQNTGRKALVAGAGGALSGFGKRLSQQQYSVESTPIGSSSALVGGVTHDALGGSAVGAADALTQSIADYYNLYAPSLQVGGGTAASLVIANELKFPPSGRTSTQTHSANP